MDAHYAYELYKAGQIETLLEEAFRGEDIMNGSSGNDILAGFGGNDKIWGGAGADLVYGGEGKDIQFGNAGDDQLYGGAGNDRQIGGLGQDTFTGGEGADTFVFRSVDEAGLGSERDVITDFTSADGDKIDLRQIDANTLEAGDQAFDFIGDTAFSGSPGQLRYSSGILSGDVDGDGSADFEIELTGSPTLTVDDFFL